MIDIQHFRSNVTRLLNVESNAERERSRSREALVHAGKMAAMGRMVASINHEIKRPLASMHLLVENALDLIARGDSQSAAENLNMLLRAASQLSELSRQLEDFSCKRPLNRTTVMMQAAVGEACSVLTPKTRTGQHELRVRVGNHHVLADHDRLTLAIVNLVDNAMDATAGTADRRIDIEAEEDERMVVLRVRDYGPGIPEEIMNRLFEAFFTTKAQGKGLGIGLALSHDVISEMGGQLGVRNHPGGGAEFTIGLPAAAPPPLPV